MIQKRNISVGEKTLNKVMRVDFAGSPLVVQWVAVAWVTAVVWVQFLARELLYATFAAKKKVFNYSLKIMKEKKRVWVSIAGNSLTNSQ